MKKLFIILLTFIPGIVFSQVTFVINELPVYTPPEAEIYIAGSFNGWDPGNSDYRLTKNVEEKFEITLAGQAQGTSIQFKFTLGSWETVEKGPNMEEIDNRVFTFGNGDTVSVIIHNWRQDGGGSTAASNVSVMDENFYIPQLDRTRRIWLYLPPDYETSGKDYPVLYMHDGQNLFDASTSFAGEWEVDETLNELYLQGLEVPIVVGIDHGGDYRIGEYTPWAHAVYGGGNGDLYLQFIVQTLKPYIDGQYRTLPGREHTGIMGSSLGGLISHYGAIQYQEVFSKAGVFSPSFWWSQEVWPFTVSAGHQDAMRVYMMCGGGEGQGTINNMVHMQDTLLANGFSEDEVSARVIPGGQHNESLWRQDFGEAYLWLFGSYANHIAGPSARHFIRLFPNPAREMLYLPADFPSNGDSLVVVDMKGRKVISISPFNGNQIDVSLLPAGIYLLSITSGGIDYHGKFVKE